MNDGRMPKCIMYGGLATGHRRIVDLHCVSKKFGRRNRKVEQLSDDGSHWYHAVQEGVTKARRKLQIAVGD